MTPAPASDFTDLVFHALAHLTTAHAGNLHDERYLAWTRRNLPPDAWRPVARDAPLLSELFQRERNAAALHALPRLHASVDAFLASASCAADELTVDDVDDARLLRRLLAVDRSLLEILRAALALAARAYAREHASGIAGPLRIGCTAVAPWLAEVKRRLPAIEDAKVELVWALGPRGRGLGDRILVGAPASWNDVEPPLPAVLALHERAVQLAELDLRGAERDETYQRSEWTGLCSGAHLLADAPRELRGAHRRWLASLSLEALVEAARKRRVVSDEDARALIEDRNGRPERLAALLR